jgi:integrase
MRKVRADPREEIRPMSRVELERLIVGFEGRDRAIVLLGGHLGLRPVEVRPVRWTVGRARMKATVRRTRLVAVPAVTARALKAWRVASGAPGGQRVDHRGDE